MSDVQSAAERLRQAFDAAHLLGEGPDEQYMDSPHDYELDLERVARAWLAEHDQTPINAEWLRSIIPLRACKHGGGYSETEVVLFLEDWESRQKERFWVLRLHDAKADGWCVSVSVQEGSRHAGTLYMASIKTRGDLRRLASALGIPLTP